MPIPDRFGLPLTTSSAAAAESYGGALDLMLSANFGAEPLLDRLCRACPRPWLSRGGRCRGGRRIYRGLAAGL